MDIYQTAEAYGSVVAFDPKAPGGVVLKVLRPTDDAEAVERFRREAIALSPISIIPAWFRSTGTPKASVARSRWSMSCGTSLAARIEADATHVSQGGLPSRGGHRVRPRLHSTLRESCIATSGPTISWCSEIGSAKLIDFGVAKIVGEPQVTLIGHKLRDHDYVSLGAVALGSASLDARTDVYSLAAIAMASCADGEGSRPRICSRQSP